MLNELRATRVSFDPEDGATVVEIGVEVGRAGRTHTDLREVPGTLLLDHDGLLAGIDLRARSGEGWVVMLEAHEDVARSEPASGLRVGRDADGKPVTLRVRGARARGSEMSIL